MLLLADTHLGFDLPLNPRVEKVRRGPDFFANTEKALASALAGEVDLVVHGGDLLFRSKVPPRLMEMAFEPLLEVADAGVPVVVVPGNHERSAIPYPLLAAHQHLHLLHTPRTVRLELGGLRVAVAGFPCERKQVQSRFSKLVATTGALEEEHHIRLLCLHQTVEGATVGPSGFTFRAGADIVRGRDLPTGFAAVLAGHIHRAQVLTRDLGGRELAAPVFYPGAIERTSFAERDEAKGFMTLDLEASANGGRVANWAFHELPARPLVDLEMDITGLSTDRLEHALRHRLESLDPRSVVRLLITGGNDNGSQDLLSAANLRRLAPDTMPVSLRWLQG